MEQLGVPKLLAGALAAVSGAVVASFFGIEGTLIGAALVSLLVAPAEALTPTRWRPLTEWLGAHWSAGWASR